MSNETKITPEFLLTLLSEYQRAAKDFKQAEGATSVARSAECTAQNRLSECRKRYKEAYGTFLKEHDAKEWRNSHGERTDTVAVGVRGTR